MTAAGGTEEFYVEAAARITADAFELLEGAPDPWWNTGPANYRFVPAVALQFCPGDATEYRIVVSRTRDFEVTVTLLGSGRGTCAVFPLRTWPLEVEYVADLLRITDRCTAWAVAAVLNRLAAVVLP